MTSAEKRDFLLNLSNIVVTTLEVNLGDVS